MANATSPVSIALILSNYELYLGNTTVIVGGEPMTGASRGPGIATSHDVCLNHLFTHTNAAPALGTAQLASVDPGFLGGICSFRPFQQYSEGWACVCF